MSRIPGKLRILPLRVKIAGLHLLVSTGVAIIAAVLIFEFWYPPPFSQIAGGVSLFLLLVSIDVVLGPALTAIAASPKKAASELRRDISMIAVVQIAAFAYGLHAVALGRPVYLSFEVVQFRVVTAANIDPETLVGARPDMRQLPWTGPKLIAAVRPTDPDEQLKSIDLGLAGFDLSMIPRNWRDYDSQRDAAWRVARPLQALLTQYPKAAQLVSEIASAAGQEARQLRFLPLVSRQESWVILLAPPNARVVGYLPLDGFF